MTLLDDARAAAARGDWSQAYRLLVDADATGALAPTDLPLLADCAYASGHVEQTIETWDRLHTEAVRAGNMLGAAAAAVRVALHLLFDTALLAPVRAWVARAERLLEGHADTPVHAWLAVVRSYDRLLSGEFAAAGTWAARAIEIGTGRDPAAAAVGRVAQARSVILQGEVARGLALLNESALATMSHDLDPITTGTVYCEVVCAMQALAQYDLAEQWTEAMERWRRDHAVGSIHGRCRVHRAEILRLRGALADAEKEALRACEELRPYLRREFGWPLNELGRIRLLKGDVDGAEEAFLAAQDSGWDPQPGLALALLARGDVSAASSGIQDALTHPSTIPSKELPPHSDLRRAPLLAAAVEIAVAANDLASAASASDELSRIAATFDSKPMRATAAFARAQVLLARGERVEAGQAFEIARQLWSEIGAPHEIHRALRGKTAAEISRAPQAPRSPNRFCRDGDYWTVSFEGKAIHVSDAVGMRYLARLLANPGRDIRALDLVSDASGHSSIRDIGDAGAMLDERAKAAYRRRLADIDADVEEARSLNDLARVEQSVVEREFILRELSRAVGLGGRDRRAGSASERARAASTRAIRHAIARIAEHHEALGAHLARCIRTGASCAYAPDPGAPIEWIIDEPH